MPMWVSCLRASDAPRAGAGAGFSLLELLVVLALISFMTALVAPRLKNTVDAISRSGERAEAARQLARLPLLARRAGRAIVAERGQALTVAGMTLPDGWAARALEPLRIEASGYCNPALLEMTAPGSRERWTLAAPDCRVGDAP